MSPAIGSKQPIKPFKHTQEKRADVRKAQLLGRLPRIRVKSLGKQLVRDGSSSDRSSCLKGTIPAGWHSVENVIAKGVCDSALEERQAILNLKAPLSAANPSLFEPSSLLLEPLSRCDVDDSHPIDDLTMTYNSLSSRSPSPTPSRKAPRLSFDRVSSVTRWPKSASRKQTHTWEHQERVISRERGRQRSLSPSLHAQGKSYHSRRSASRGRRKSLSHSPKRLDAAEAHFKTSIFTNSEKSNPSILGSPSRSESITRTIVSVAISPAQDGLKIRRASKSRIRSHSRRGTPLPQSPTYIGGYRMLASDRDIYELLQQRLTQKSNRRKKKATPDLKGWKPAWSNAVLEKGFEESTRESSALTDDQRPEKTALTISRNLDYSNAVDDNRVLSTNPKSCRPIRMTNSHPEHVQVNGSSKLLNEQRLEPTDQIGVTAKCSDSSGKRSLSPSEFQPKRPRTDDILRAEGRSMSVTFVPDTSRLAVSQKVSIALLLKPNTTKSVQCSACINSRCRCIRVIEGNGSCERCIDRGLQCAVPMLPDDARGCRRLKIGRQEARQPERPMVLFENHEHTEAPMQFSRTKTFFNHQDNDLSIATQPRGLPPIENLHLPQAYPPNSSTETSSQPSEVWPNTPFHAQLQNQQGYGWVKDWNIVQPQRTHPTRRQRIHQPLAKTQHNFQTATQYHTGLIHSQDQRGIPPSEGFGPQQHRSSALTYTHFPLSHAAIRTQQDEHHYPIQQTGPTSHFTGWGPLTGSQHLPQPQLQPRHRQWP